MQFGSSMRSLRFSLVHLFLLLSLVAALLAGYRGMQRRGYLRVECNADDVRFFPDSLHVLDYDRQTGVLQIHDLTQRPNRVIAKLSLPEIAGQGALPAQFQDVQPLPGDRILVSRGLWVGDGEFLLIDCVQQRILHRVPTPVGRLGNSADGEFVLRPLPTPVGDDPHRLEVVRLRDSAVVGRIEYDAAWGSPLNRAAVSGDGRQVLLVTSRGVVVQADAASDEVPYKVRQAFQLFGKRQAASEFGIPPVNFFIESGELLYHDRDRRMLALYDLAGNETWEVPAPRGVPPFESGIAFFPLGNGRIKCDNRMGGKILLDCKNRRVMRELDPINLFQEAHYSSDGRLLLLSDREDFHHFAVWDLYDPARWSAYGFGWLALVAGAAVWGWDSGRRRPAAETSAAARARSGRWLGVAILWPLLIAAAAFLVWWRWEWIRLSYLTLRPMWLFVALATIGYMIIEVVGLRRTSAAAPKPAASRWRGGWQIAGGMALLALVMPLTAAAMPWSLLTALLLALLPLPPFFDTRVFAGAVGAVSVLVAILALRMIARGAERFGRSP